MTTPRSRTRIAPHLETFILDFDWPGYRPAPVYVAHAKRELRALLAVVRAAASDPDPHHRVSTALARLARLSTDRTPARRSEDRRKP